MIYVEAPQFPRIHGRSLFLAGGISNVRNWQSQLIEYISDLDIIIYNPRRANFNTDDNSEKVQIHWEYEMLRKSEAISFWFSNETLQPITLFELGAHSLSMKPLFIGVHPNYPRKDDVIIQMKLARPDIQIVPKLDLLANQIRQYFMDSKIYVKQAFKRSKNGIKKNF